ncbi:hypothetical protein BFN03_16575 [Rhodococcus sp. WMMA185]|uniref:hypothetical protein n=1 Tax=Rhodococcus sp. WMMA185 TaxID=679318 RepID=UPI0008785C5A|nr:hypothetical protein [Rhodococcus sp. WMMA185]AOW93717.1 hypothetical protein BFN03_16575 [Rhodococcus sp. WMMA185]
MYSNKAAFTVTLAAVVTTLSACGGGSDEADDSAAVQWDAAEPCTLADAETLAPLLTAGAGEGTTAEHEDRRACVWGVAEALNTVTISTTDAPDSGDSLRTFDVGGLESRVLAESKYHCVLETTTEAGTLSIETKFGLDAITNPDRSCERSVPLAEHVLNQLNWT